MTLVIVAAALLGLVTVAFVLYPVFRASALGHRYITDSATSDRLAELLAQRDAVYEAIRDADFDRETGKLTEEDHRLMRSRLTAEGVRLLQELDRLMQSEVREHLEQEIEREVAALREARASETSEEERQRRESARVGPAPAEAVDSDEKMVACPACDGRVRHTAQFCTHCGASLDRTCPACGTVVEASDRFCSHCGARLPGTDEAAEVLNAEVAE